MCLGQIEFLFARIRATTSLSCATIKNHSRRYPERYYPRDDAGPHDYYGQHGEHDYYAGPAMPRRPRLLRLVCSPLSAKGVLAGQASSAAAADDKFIDEVWDLCFAASCSASVGGIRAKRINFGEAVIGRPKISMKMSIAKMGKKRVTIAFDSVSKGKISVQVQHTEWYSVSFRIRRELSVCAFQNLNFINPS